MKDVLLIEQCIHCKESHLVGLEIKRSPFASVGSRMPAPKKFSRVLVCSATKKKFKLETYIFTPPEMEYISIQTTDMTSNPIEMDTLVLNTDYFDEYGLTPYLTENGVPLNCMYVPPGGIRHGDFNIIGIVTA